MQPNKEILALLHLIDDPDEEVFDVISQRIIDYGKPIIPNLEDLWENTPDSMAQERIEILIHKLYYGDLANDMREWGTAGHQDLLLGALLVSKFLYPDIASSGTLRETEKIKRNIWLELNNYLTPLEQINVFTSILYSYYGLKGCEMSYANPNEFLIHKTLEAKKGNQVGNGILYLILCEMLDLPIRLVQIPRQFILAYFRPGYTVENINDPQKMIEYYIDPAAGQIYTHNDVDAYFKSISVPPSASHFRPLSNKEVIKVLLGEFSKCFTKDENMYKHNELLQLSALLD